MAARRTWEPIAELPASASGWVLSFDQTLRSTGWALLRAGAPVLELVAAGTCRTKAADDEKGWEDTLRSSVELMPQLRDVFRAASAAPGMTLPPEVHVLGEQPPVGPVHRPESIYIASSLLWLAAQANGFSRPVMMQSQHVKAVLTGRKGAEKRDVKEALEALPFLAGAEKLTNEHIRDAVAQAVVFLAERG